MTRGGRIRTLHKPFKRAFYCPFCIQNLTIRPLQIQAVAYLPDPIDPATEITLCTARAIKSFRVDDVQPYLASWTKLNEEFKSNINRLQERLDLLHRLVEAQPTQRLLPEVIERKLQFHRKWKNFNSMLTRLQRLSVAAQLLISETMTSLGGLRRWKASPRPSTSRARYVR